MLLEAVIFVLLLAFWWKFEDGKKHRGCPPGPIRFPLVGNLPQLFLVKAPLPTMAMDILSKKYGPLMFLQMGSMPAVVFSSYESITEIFHHETAGVTRGPELMPVIYDRQMRKNLGIIFCNGEAWQTLRRFTLRTLRDFGFGKAISMDFVINEEFGKFMAHFNKQIEASSDNVMGGLEEVFDISIINIVWRLVTGVNYDMDDPKIAHLLKISYDWMKSTNGANDLSFAFPSMHEYLGRRKQLEKMDRLHAFCQEAFTEHRKAGTYSSDPQSFVDVFLAKIDEQKGSEVTAFTDEHLILTILDLFQAGAETTSKTLSFGLLYMLLNPEVQKKVQDEIDSVVPQTTLITMSFKSQLPYCHATVLEMLRHSSVVPLPPIRRADEDFYCEGYLIQKGTALLLNTDGVNLSAFTWGDDSKAFRPERFLTKDGKVDAKIADRVLAFGGGKRKCLGFQLAECSLLIYFTSMMRHYNLVKVAGQPDPSTVPVLGLTYGPQPFSAKIVCRA